MFLFKTEKIRVRRRGTACLPTEKGVLVVQERRGGRWYLPGGGAKHDERSIRCATRELYEETGVRGSNPVHLLDVKGQVHRGHKGKLYQNLYKVFIYDTVDSSIPRVVSEIKGIGFYKHGSDMELSHTTKKILDAYFNTVA